MWTLDHAVPKRSSTDVGKTVGAFAFRKQRVQPCVGRHDARPSCLREKKRSTPSRFPHRLLHIPSGKTVGALELTS